MKELNLSALGSKGAVFFRLSSAQHVVRAFSAACGESKIVVEVKRDLFGTSQLIKPSGISLGDCAVPLQNDWAQTLIFETPRFHNLSSNALKPTWVPYTSTKSAEDVLGFTMGLMNEWLQHVCSWTASSQRSCNVFYLGDVLNIEAPVTQANHQPPRLFVDSCVATLVPDQTSTPSYSFIENKGCLTDAKLTGSNSQFMPRFQDSKLQMKLDAFRFQREARNLIYITCHLKVTAVSQSVDSLNKDCYSEGSRWRSVDGSDQVCSCCDSRCAATV
nr:PREDICTED: zona pellucida sperm-binding protein 3-like [Lepisosteus oculatus]